MEIRPDPSQVSTGQAGAGPTSTGFALLPHDDESAETERGRLGRPEPSLASAAALWTDSESLFDEPTPPASMITGGLVSAPTPDPGRGASTPSARVTPVALPSRGEPARPSGQSLSGRDAARANRAGEGPQSARSKPKPVDEDDDAAEEKGPLRIWIPQGQEGETGRRGPPSDTGGRVWDTSEVLFRQVEGDALFDQPREDAMTQEEDDIDPSDIRAPGELPRTWLNPLSLPASLDRPHANRPRRIGGVVQPVPGTPSAIAIAREEAESARYGPPPPLVSPTPVLMSSSWAQPEPEEDEPLPPLPRSEPSGFQLVTDMGSPSSPRESAPMVVGESSNQRRTTPPVGRSAESAAPVRPPPQTVSQTGGSTGGSTGGPTEERSAALYMVIAFLAVFIVGGILIFAMHERDKGDGGTPVEPVEVPGADPTDAAVGAQEDGVPAGEPATPAPALKPTAPTGNPCDAPASEAQTGILMVTSNRGGTLYVDGKSCGQLPLQNGIRLKAEQHSVRVVTSGGRRQDAKVVVEAERAKNVPFEF